MASSHRLGVVAPTKEQKQLPQQQQSTRSTSSNCRRHYHHGSSKDDGGHRNKNPSAISKEIFYHGLKQLDPSLQYTKDAVEAFRILHGWFLSIVGNELVQRSEEVEVGATTAAATATTTAGAKQQDTTTTIAPLAISQIQETFQSLGFHDILDHAQLLLQMKSNKNQQQEQEQKQQKHRQPTSSSNKKKQILPSFLNALVTVSVAVQARDGCFGGMDTCKETLLFCQHVICND